MSALASFIDCRALEGQLLKYLDIAGIQSLHATESSMSIACGRNEIWIEAVVQALPGFALNLALFETERRQLFRGAFPSLAKAVVARGTSVSLSSMDDASNILPMLNRANKAVADHIQKGHLAQVVVGCLRFDHGVRADALCRSGSSDETVDLEICCSERIEIQKMHELFPSWHRWNAFCFEFAWKHGILAVRVSPVSDAVDASQISEREESLTLDIAISCSALTLQQRGVKVEIGGGWSSGTSGISSFRHGTGAAADALSNGVTCVLCLRAGAVETNAPSRVSHALHLDQARMPAMRQQAMYPPAIRRGASW